MAELNQQIARDKSLLSPIERVSEILFGLIMALTFTCTINIVEADRSDVKDTLIAAIGCNIAWGIVDAVMYLLNTLAERGRNKTILRFVQTTSQIEIADQFISDALPPVIASVTSAEQLERIRQRLSQIPEASLEVRITKTDLKTALGIFLLVFISTFPIAIPFIIVHDAKVALRISNLVAIVLMFICGWLLAKYGGYNKWIASAAMTLIGLGLVGLTVSLGG
jgi:hypothetical protein